MFQEYFELYKTYTQKYGPKTAIFLMVGAFYELYELQDVETGEMRSNVKEIVDILGIQVSIKKEVEPGHNGLVAGFPDYVMHKWAGRLTATGWTVVVVDQVKERGKVKERVVSRILSPSTHIENIASGDIPYIVTLYFEENKGPPAFGKGPPSFGAAILDLTTGTTNTYSGVANGKSDIWTADDIVQMLSVFQPKELLIYWNGCSIPEVSVFSRIFGILQIPIHVRPTNVGSFSKELVRTEYLQKIYSIKSILPVKTYLGLRTDTEELALLFLLQFVEEHYPSMLQSFHRNKPWVPEERLICGNHALTQLQMTSVVSLFDKSITPMGKRDIRYRLLCPYSDPNEIKSRLREIQEYMIWPQDKALEKQLRFICDLPRFHRKIQCGIITPQEITSLFHSYSAIEVIMKLTEQTSLEAKFTWINYKEVFHANFNQEKAQLASNDITAFNINKYKEIGEKEEEIKTTIDDFIKLKCEIAKKSGVHEDAIRMEERDKEPYGFKCSSVTLAQVKKEKDLKISELKSGGWIDCVKLQQLNTKLQKLRENLNNLVKIYLVDACLEISESNVWFLVEKWISHIDCTQCIARVSIERGFSCPKIEIGESGCDIKGLRHPLVEATQTRVSYVKHDVALGMNKSNGWLVYGMNASGKSTLMKATGICILLAQAGCFVPAKEMTLRPFRAIYTRILNQDNLFAGLSSFAVEMSELRDILRNANENTLVLGDELCSGTESISAQALVASGIQWLTEKNAKFIFATHLHDLPNIVDSVEVWHLHVEYDAVTQKLVYDRSLRPGNGSSLYGLEVARAMDLPFEFIEQALKNRHKIIGTTNQIDASKSKWNTNIVRKECEICNKKTDLEVHHIKERSEAVNGILKDGTNMNDKRNLIVICQDCHDSVHAGNIEIGDIKVTSNGPERQIKSKWTEEEHKIIMDTLQKYSKLSLKSLRAHLSSKHEINISETVLGKMKRT